MDVVSVPLNDFDARERGMEGVGERWREGGREGSGGERQVCGRSSFTRPFWKHKKGGCSANLFYFCFVLLLSVHAGARTETSDMTKPMRTLLGMRSNKRRSRV